ncbi:MAG: hypothetical protein RLZZ488_2549 [Pseudomonadota bacterium]|jgi:hypothetical protein
MSIKLKADFSWSRLLILLGAVFFVGCMPVRCGKREDVAAEEQLRNYIDLAVNITRMDQREELESYTTGEFRDQLTSSSVESFKRSYLERRYEFEVFEVTNKTEVEAGREVQLEYRVKFKSWLTGEDKARAPVQEVSSVAIMKYTNGHWAIASIKPLNSEYNWDVGLPLEGISTQGVNENSPVVDPYAESENSETPANQPVDATAPVPAQQQ